MGSEQLRKMANELRKVAAEAETERQMRVAETIKAAHALNLIRKKVTLHAR